MQAACMKLHISWCRSETTYLYRFGKAKFAIVLLTLAKLYKASKSRLAVSSSQMSHQMSSGSDTFMVMFCVAARRDASDESSGGILF